jgi:hypothetical protein
MTHTLPGADIRGYYQELGITLPDWAHTEASVPCFIDPDAHHHHDHDPSMSINLEHGAFHCNGCGAKGGAYDAATARGHDARSAIELMIDHGLTHRRRQTRPSRTRRRSSPVRVSAAHARPQPSVTRQLATSTAGIQRWHLQLLADAVKLAWLVAHRGWCPLTIRRLQLGLDQGRITIPVHDHRHQLVSLLRYRPDHGSGEAKLRAAPGSRRALYPHPAADSSRELLLVEGEPDAIAARSRGLAAVAIPGVNGWNAEWAPLFADRAVTVVFDADTQARTCARKVAHDLAGHVAQVTVIDLDPARDDGYDLTDWLLERRGEGARIHRKLHAIRAHAACID